MSSSDDDLYVGKDASNLVYVRIYPDLLENARQQDRAAFFEDEGLNEFLNLDWDIEVDENLVLQFLLNYNAKNRTVILRGEEISIDDELMLKVFHLPRGICKMPKKNKATRVVSPYFPDLSARRKGGDKGFDLAGCNDEVWLDRFRFLHYVFTIRTDGRKVPYYFIEFLQEEGKKRNWIDAFRWFFQAEIGRIKKCKGAKTPSTIGSHITLLLAHIQKKKKPQQVGHKQKRVTRRQLAPEQMDRKCQEPQSVRDSLRDEENEAEEEERKNHKDEVEEEETIHPSLSIINAEDQILRHHDMERQGISELLKRMALLRTEVELWKSEYGNRIALLRNENDSLQKEVEKWKNEMEKWKTECGKVGQARGELEAKVTAFCTTVNSSKITRILPEDNTSLGFATPPPSKKLKAKKLPKTENVGD